MAELPAADWQKLLQATKLKSTALYSALRMAKPYASSDELVLAFEFPLHYKKVNQPKNLSLISQQLKNVLGSQLTIKCQVDKNLANQKTQIVTDSASKPPGEEVTNFQTLKSIFGSVELLES